MKKTELHERFSLTATPASDWHFQFSPMKYVTANTGIVTVASSTDPLYMPGASSAAYIIAAAAPAVCALWEKLSNDPSGNIDITSLPSA